MKRLRPSAVIQTCCNHPRSSRQLSTALCFRRTPHSNFQPQHECISTTSFSPLPSQRNSSFVRYTSSSASSSSKGEKLSKTPLYDLHLSHGGKMVPFAGYHMPVQYSSLSVSDSHHFTRSHASLFDVSHMVQHLFSGPGVNAFLERITPADVTGIQIGRGGLSALLWPQTGGIVDDTILTRVGPERFYVVTNAACREKDLKYLEEELEAFKKEGGEDVDWEVLEGWGLIALQGPLSEDILTQVLVTPEEEKLRDMHFGQSRYIKIVLLDGRTSSPLLLSRGGYTGEDGFEISIPPSEAVAVTDTLLVKATPEKLQLAGLGARDSLRLEAGMCLYGHDLDDTTTPPEAALSWIVPKARRATGGFHGAENILPQLTSVKNGGTGVSRRRVGLVVEGAPAREGAKLLLASKAEEEAEEEIGIVTSGCPSPTLNKNIAMGYVKDGYHKAGTELVVLVRKHRRKATVTKMPFVPSKYWKGAAPA